jgi:hypothetical protein
VNWCVVVMAIGGWRWWSSSSDGGANASITAALHSKSAATIISGTALTDAAADAVVGAPLFDADGSVNNNAEDRRLIRKRQRPRLTPTPSCSPLQLSMSTAAAAARNIRLVLDKLSLPSSIHAPFNAIVVGRPTVSIMLDDVSAERFCGCTNDDETSSTSSLQPQQEQSRWSGLNGGGSAEEQDGIIVLL